MREKYGYQIEQKMKRWFRGNSYPRDCVDFQTVTSLYEVKSCRLFIRCTNENVKRTYKLQLHKKIYTTQHGRFRIKRENHLRLKEVALQENKIPKYIFVLDINGQLIFRVRQWEEVDSLVNKEKLKTYISIKDIFFKGE